MIVHKVWAWYNVEYFKASHSWISLFGAMILDLSRAWATHIREFFSANSLKTVIHTNLDPRTISAMQYFTSVAGLPLL